MTETKETKQEITFDEFYNDLSNNWDNDDYVIQTLKNLNECVFIPYQKKFLEGLLLQKQGKYEEGFRCFQESNEIEENGYALNKLALCYEKGEGVEKNLVESIKLYKLAIEKENIHAINNLGFCYDKGIGVDKNPVEAVRLYKLAVEKGNIIAHYNLGYCYYFGEGVDKNPVEAIKLYKLAVEKGNTIAMNNLGSCYYFGEGVDKNIDEAIRLYKLASDKGSILAHYNLALCYYNGEGVDKNPVEAIKLYKLYFEKSDDRNFRNLIECYKQLTFNQKYDFYNSLSKNSPILEVIEKENEIDCLKFKLLKMQEKINELEKYIFLPPFADPRLPNGGPGFQNALASRNDFDE